METAEKLEPIQATATAGDQPQPTEPINSRYLVISKAPTGWVRGPRGATKAKDTSSLPARSLPVGDKAGNGLDTQAALPGGGDGTPEMNRIQRLHPKTERPKSWLHHLAACRLTSRSLGVFVF